MKESRQRRRPAFLWQGLFILLPVFVLALVGLLSLRQDRLLAEQEAKQRAQQMADDLAGKIRDALTAVSGLPQTTNWFDLSTADAVDTNFIFEIDEFARLIFPPDYPAVPIPRAPDETKLSAEQQRLFHSAHAAEFRERNAAVAVRAYRQFLASKPPSEFDAANLGLALLLLKQG
jgi:CHASE1-domain containing sensor protein